MVGGTWLVVPRPWSCGSTLGIRLERSFTQIAANGSSEPKIPDAAKRSIVRNRIRFIRQNALGVFKIPHAKLN